MNNPSIRAEYEALIESKIEEAKRVKVTDDKYLDIMKSISDAYKVTNEEDKILFDGQNKIDDRDLEIRKIDIEEMRIELDKMAGERDMFKFSVGQMVSGGLGVAGLIVIVSEMSKDRNFGLENIKTSPVSRITEGLLGRLFKFGR